MTQQMFGGDWTEEKLERVRKYLSAYTTIMKQNPRSKYYRIAYIDAFAGTGYRNIRVTDNLSQLQFPELVEEESVRFLDGSARIALRVEPPYDTYIFVEKDSERVNELERLKNEYPERDIRIHRDDANDFLISLCRRNWEKSRAVLFLDPFGMEVAWTTIEAIAQTEAIDLWYLFPLGINRMLPRDGNVTDLWNTHLDRLFGEHNWFTTFYRSETQTDLFGTQETRLMKLADFKVITNYVLDRLRSVFPFVASNPLILSNSRNSPLFLLCFAAGNKKGGPTAIKIAQDILKGR